MFTICEQCKILYDNKYFTLSCPHNPIPEKGATTPANPAAVRPEHQKTEEIESDSIMPLESYSFQYGPDVFFPFEDMFAPVEVFPDEAFVPNHHRCGVIAGKIDPFLCDENYNQNRIMLQNTNGDPPQIAVWISQALGQILVWVPDAKNFLLMVVVKSDDLGDETDEGYP